jgi:3-deoxy-D-arabino-heptulosonate 7-phosphate (DAHP) synthase class II
LSQAAASNELQRALGTTYNNATLRYDLAYNQTSGIALDLVQSIGQAGIQWSSQVSGWLNNLSLMPDTVNAQYQQLMREISTLNATELSEHVKNYPSDILQG